jgi:hypothetical protein
MQMPSGMVRHLFATLLIIFVLAAAIFMAMLSSVARVKPQWTPARQLFYRFTYQGEAVYRFEALFSGKTTAKPTHLYSAVTGTLVETTVASDSGGATQLWNIVDPDVRYIAGSAFDAIYGAQLRTDLQYPLVTRADAHGRIVSVASGPDESQIGVQFMRSVLGRMQLVVPDRSSRFERSWTADEPDADGSRTSDYTLDRWISGSFANATVGFVRRTSITVAHPSTSLVHRPDILGAGLDRGVWRLDGTLDTLTSADSRNTYYGQTLIARSQSALAVQLLGTADLDAKRLATSLAFADAQLHSQRATALHVESSQREVTRAAFTNVLGSDDDQSLAARLVEMTRHADRADVSALAQRFAALFYLRPQTIGEFEPLLLRARSESIPFDVLAAAFQQAGTPAAQSALATVAKRRATEPHAGESLAMTMGFIQDPTTTVESALSFIMEHGEPDAADSAELALGSVAGELGNLDGERQAAIVHQIEQRLEAATDDDARQTALLALGNARATSSLDDILKFQHDASSDLRAAVATALRGIDDPRADAALVTLLQDPDPTVRLAAASAFELRLPSPAAFAALRSTAQADPDAGVRAEVLTAVWDARNVFPTAASTVSAALHDRDERVRTAAETLLASPGEGQERPAPPSVSGLPMH